MILISSYFLKKRRIRNKFLALRLKIGDQSHLVADFFLIVVRQKYADRPEILKPLEEKLVQMNSMNLSNNRIPWATIISEANVILNEVSRTADN